MAIMRVSLSALLLLVVVGAGLWLWQTQDGGGARPAEMSVAPGPGLQQQQGSTGVMPTIQKAVRLSPNRRIDDKVDELTAGKEVIADYYEDLRALAQQGNPAAALRLFQDLDACALLEVKASQLEDANKRNVAESSVSQRLADLELELTRCEGISDEAIAERVEWLKTAARGGHIEAKSRFWIEALAEFENPRVVLSRADEFAALRREAAQHLRDAAAAGNHNAMSALAYEAEVGGLVERDLVSAYVNYSALYAVRGSPGFRDHMDRLFAMLPTEQRTLAQRRASEFIERCCK